MKLPTRVPFSRREIVAMHFAAALIGARDRQPEHPGRSNRSLVLDAFALSDAFLDERNRSFPTHPDKHGQLGECGCS
jgi:hypothetical protein